MENGMWIVVLVVMMVVAGGIGYMVNSGDSDIPLITEAQVNTAVNSAVSQAVAGKDATITTLSQKVNELINASSTGATINPDGTVETTSDIKANEQSSITDYLLDGLYLEESIDETLSDREINLFDGEVEFDDKDYDAEETLNFKGIIQANNPDFEGKSYLVVPENGIVYKLVFENSLETDLIKSDKTLKFNFLGELVEVSEWNVDTITFTKGNEYFMDQGDSVTVNNKTIVLDVVMEDSVYVKVGSEGKKISEGSSATVGGIEVKVNEVLYSGYVGGYQKAELIIGDDISQTVDSGDEYEDDSIWEWIIDANSIGLTLKEEHRELDEDYSALDVDDLISLPNDYVSIRFDGLIDEDTETYKFEVEHEGLVEVRGNFRSGINDYTKIYLNSTDMKIFDDDDDEIVGDIYLGDSDLTISVNKTTIVIDDIEMSVDLTSIVVDGKDISSMDYDWMTDFGIVIDSPEDTVEPDGSGEIRLTVPEEKLEFEVSFI